MTPKPNRVLIEVVGSELWKQENFPYLREIVLLGLDELTEFAFEPPMRFPIMKGKKKVGEVIAI